MKENTFAQIAVVLLFAISFMVIGVTTPVLYASYAPQDNFIKVHSFDAQDAGTGASSHYICFDRTINHPTTGTSVTELYLVNGGDERIELDSQSEARYFQDGRQSVITPIHLPDNLPEGEYRYVMITELKLADGQVERSFSFRSSTFTVSDDHSDNPIISNFDCK